MVARGEEEAPVFLVLEIGDHSIDERLGFAQPAGVSGGAVQPQQAVRQEGVILEVGRQLGAALRDRSAAAVRPWFAASRAETRRPSRRPARYFSSLSTR